MQKYRHSRKSENPYQSIDCIRPFLPTVIPIPLIVSATGRYPPHYSVVLHKLHGRKISLTTPANGIQTGAVALALGQVIQLKKRGFHQAPTG